MSTLPQRPSAQPGDGLGYRVLGFDKKTGDRLEMLRVRPQFSGHPQFETALRDRLRRLAEFRHPAFARVRQIDRLSGQAAGIAIVSNHLEGVRLADLLNVAESYQVRVDIDTTLCLLRQLVSAVAGLHTCSVEISHGCIGPERLLLTPDARLVVTEYVLGGALEAMQWSRERFWQEFRIALPQGPDPASFDQQVDILQIGLVGLALLEGRGIYAERHYPLPLAERIKQAREIPVSGNLQPLKPAFTTWLTRALQLDPVSAFRSLDDALVTLDLVIGEGYLASTTAVTAFVDRCRQASPDLRPREAESSSEMTQTLSRTMLDLGAASGEKPGAGAQGPASPSASVPGASQGKPADLRPAAKATPGAPAPPTTTVPASGASGKPGTPAASPNVTAGSPASGGSSAGATSGTPTKPGPIAAAPPTHTAGTPASGSSASSSSAAAPPATASATSSAGKTPEATTAAAKASAARADAVKADAVKAGAAADFLGGDTMVDDTSAHVPAALVAASRPRVRMPLMVAFCLVAVIGIGAYPVMKYANPFGGTPPEVTPATAISAKGILAIDASPRSATVYIDDVARGTTPLRVELSPGQHNVRLDGGENITRTFPVTVTPGKEISHLVELSRNLETGALDVRSDPPGARVSLDGKVVGTSPVSLADITPGDHIIVVEGQQGSVRQAVKVIAGTRASIVVPLNATPASPAAGWLSVVAPHELQVLQDGQLIGTSRTEKFMMPAGSYQLELSNDALGFSVSRSVQVQPGKITRLAVDIPGGTLSVNATPWAEIWVDGTRYGETPVGNLQMPAGTHEVVFRNPKFADKKQTVVIKPGQPARVTMDMTK